MAARKMLDQQPGVTPEVHRDGEAVTFVLDVAGAPDRIKLVLRCTRTDILASVISVPEPRA